MLRSHLNNSKPKALFRHLNPNFYRLQIATLNQSSPMLASKLGTPRRIRNDKLVKLYTNLPVVESVTTQSRASAILLEKAVRLPARQAW